MNPSNGSNAAYLLGMVFDRLALDPTDQHKKWAKELYQAWRDFEFLPEALDASGSLFKLSLAIHCRKCAEVIYYGEDDYHKGICVE